MKRPDQPKQCSLATKRTPAGPLVQKLASAGFSWLRLASAGLSTSSYKQAATALSRRQQPQAVPGCAAQKRTTIITALSLAGAEFSAFPGTTTHTSTRAAAKRIVCCSETSNYRRWKSEKFFTSAIFTTMQLAMTDSVNYANIYTATHLPHMNSLIQLEVFFFLFPQTSTTQATSTTHTRLLFYLKLSEPKCPLKSCVLLQRGLFFR